MAWVRYCSGFLVAMALMAPGLSGVRADGSGDWSLYTHTHLHFTLRIPTFLQPSRLPEYLDPYAPSIDAAWLFPEMPARITLGAFAGLGAFDLDTMADWPGRKQTITLPANVPAFEQTSLVHQQFTIDIYIPYKASGDLVQLSFAATVPNQKRRAKLADIEQLYADEIRIFRAICSSFALTSSPAPEKH